MNEIILIVWAIGIPICWLAAFAFQVWEKAKGEYFDEYFGEAFVMIYFFSVIWIFAIPAMAIVIAGYYTLTFLAKVQDKLAAKLAARLQARCEAKDDSSEEVSCEVK